MSWGCEDNAVTLLKVRHGHKQKHSEARVIPHPHTTVWVCECRREEGGSMEMNPQRALRVRATSALSTLPLTAPSIISINWWPLRHKRPLRKYFQRDTCCESLCLHWDRIDLPIDCFVSRLLGFTAAGSSHDGYWFPRVAAPHSSSMWTVALLRCFQYIQPQKEILGFLKHTLIIGMSREVYIQVYIPRCLISFLDLQRNLTNVLKFAETSVSANIRDFVSLLSKSYFFWGLSNED